MTKNIADTTPQAIEEFNPVGQVTKMIGSSFYRGEHCNFNPYKSDFKNSEFLQKFLVNGWVPSGPVIDKNTRITAFGSCFATHITNYLSKVGYNLSKNREPEIYISSMGEGLVNTFAILQQFEWALETVVPPQNLWHGFNAEEFGYNEEIRLKTRQVFLETDFFILTLGLSEIWYDDQSGGVFWRAIPRNHFDPDRHKFRVSSFEETKSNLARIIQLINQHVPNAKILITLSPVPLAATFRQVSCVTANAVSKSILRSALDEVFRENSQALNQSLFYFPSYEIIMELFPEKYRDDNRHPRDEILNFTMKLFETIFCESQLSMDEVNLLFQETRKKNVQALAENWQDDLQTSTYKNQLSVQEKSFQSQVDVLVSSDQWMLAEFIRQITFRLAPKNSWRAKLLNRIIKRISTWMKNKHTPTEFSELVLIQMSGLFNENWYLSHYPDVAATNIEPIKHYLQFGGFEDRNPGPDFDSRWYLQKYPDVQQAKYNPLTHYVRYGRLEGRKPIPS